VRVNFANEVAMFAMKGVTIAQRTKAKDYYDLYMITKHLEGGPVALGKRLIAVKHNKIIVEAIDNVRQYFDSPKGLGPTSVADFMGEDNQEAREIIQRDAYEVMQSVIGELDRVASAADAGS
jgi:predicted nucleotidyltransferase component of viral defense system